MSVWQIASGDEGRDFSHLFLEHDLMCIGPGDGGNYVRRSDSSPDEVGEGCRYSKLSALKAGMIDRFCTSVQPGDVVLMRSRHRVVAIGVAASEGYFWDRSFDDVHGWQLQHTQRVLWQRQLADELERIQLDGDLFQTYKQIPVFTRVQNPAILDRVKYLFDRFEDRSLKDRPPVLPKPLELDALGERLFSKGLSMRATDDVIRAIERQRRLFTWYEEHGKVSGRPDEHEVVAHMVIPLLLALGWSEQLLAVEWNRIDLSGFSAAPTVRENCVLVCEAKRMGRGLENVLKQAQEYVTGQRLVACQKIVLCEGSRFYIYERDQTGGWGTDAVGYVNLMRIREKYLTPAGANGVDSLIALTPGGALTPLSRSND